MLTKIKTTSRKALSLMLVFAMCFTAFVLCNPIESEAYEIGDYYLGRYYYYPEGTTFISTLNYGRAEKSDDAYNAAVSGGYTLLMNDNGGGRLDFNSGVSGKDYIFLAYKTTTDINQALGTYLRNGHDLDFGSDLKYNFIVDGKSVEFKATQKNGNGDIQDLNADVSSAPYIYLFATQDPSVGLPIVALAGSNVEGASKNGYYTVEKNNDGVASDCNEGCGGDTDYVYIFFDNCSPYSDITKTVQTLIDALERTKDVQAQSLYTAESWATYQAALNEANRIWGIYNNKYKAGYATEAQINAAVTNLNNAVTALKTTIKLDATTNGGTAETTEYVVPCGLNTTVDFPAGLYSATKEGYSFLGWSTDKNAAAGSRNNMNLPLGSTVYAIFSINKYSVYFSNPITLQTIDKQTVEYGKDATEPAMDKYTTKDVDSHYVFMGWDKEFTNVTDNITVNAQFSTEDHNYIRTKYVPATCTTRGTEIYKCNDCGQEKTVTLVIDGANHKNTVDYPAKGSTCKEYGYTAYTYCNDCKTIVSGREILPLADCSWTDWVITKPSCTVDGVKTRKCTVCGKTESEKIAASGHKWSDWKVVKEATCEAAGRRQRVCSSCSTTEVEIIDALTHKYIDTVVPPTCTAQGYTTHVCERGCGSSYIDSYVDATGHNWEDVGDPIKEATCLDTGIQYQECSECDATQNAVVPALGHDWQNKDIIKDATCDTDGLMGATCDRCGEVQSNIVIPALGHDWDDGTVTKEATCTENGIRALTCQRTECGKTMETVIKAKGHDWDDGVVTSEATCSQTGEKTETCKTCGETQSVVIPKLSHKYVGVVTPPTCIDQGYTEYKCSECNDEIIDDYVPAKGHSFSVTVVPPTCIKEGYTFAKCSNCTHSQKTDFVPALDHDYKVTTVDPTCTEKGYDLHVCSRGDSEYKDNYVDALGHSHSMTVVPPTCTEEGYDKYECSVCGDIYKENFTEALGHSYNEVGRVEPQGTQSGYILYRCDNCNHEYKEIIFSGDKALVCITIYDGNGNPVKEAKITFTNLGTGETFIIYTDLNGYFTEVLPEGSYELLIDKDGYDDTYGYIVVEDGEAQIDIPVMNAVTCDCYCHQDNFWAKIFKIFMKLRRLFGLEVNCCDNPQV